MQDDRLKSSLSNAVVRLFRQVNRVHNRRLKDAGISAEQAHILLILELTGPLTIGQLQKQLALSSATLTGAIDRLEAQELVRRVPSPDDRRAFLVEPRLPARKRTQIEAAVDAGEKQCFGMLGATERRDLLKLLEKCIAGLEADAAAH
jgi:DNA-binding MarR family transcriptional regulator